MSKCTSFPLPRLTKKMAVGQHPQQAVEAISAHRRPTAAQVAPMTRQSAQQALVLDSALVQMDAVLVRIEAMRRPLGQHNRLDGWAMDFARLQPLEGWAMDFAGLHPLEGWAMDFAGLHPLEG